MYTLYNIYNLNKFLEVCVCVCVFRDLCLMLAGRHTHKYRNIPILRFLPILSEGGKFVQWEAGKFRQLHYTACLKACHAFHRGNIILSHTDKLYTQRERGEGEGGIGDLAGLPQSKALLLGRLNLSFLPFIFALNKLCICRKEIYLYKFSHWLSHNNIINIAALQHSSSRVYLIIISLII